MRNYIQPGEVITATAPAGGIISGAPMMYGSLFGVAAVTAAAGVQVEIATMGVFDLPKKAGDTFAPGRQGLLRRHRRQRHLDGDGQREDRRHDARGGRQRRHGPRPPRRHLDLRPRPMSRRPALVTQADVARAIRAARAAGLTIVRVVARPDGIAIETTDLPAPPAEEPRKRIVL